MFGISTHPGAARAIAVALLFSLLASGTAVLAAATLTHQPAGQFRQERVHRVAAGETLADIAKRYYGDASEWRRLARYNGVAGTQPLERGRQLRVPVKGLFVYPGWALSAALLAAGLAAAVMVIGHSACDGASGLEKALVSLAALAAAASALTAGVLGAGALAVAGWGVLAFGAATVGALLASVLGPAVVFYSTGINAGRAVAAASMLLVALAAGGGLFAGSSLLYIP